MLEIGVPHIETILTFDLILIHYFPEPSYNFRVTEGQNRVRAESTVTASPKIDNVSKARRPQEVVQSFTGQ